MESVPQLRRLLDLVPRRREYSLIASLPKNSVSLAVKAEEAGVDAVMLNIEGDEGSSSQGHYGGYDLHDAYINDVISTISVPCGICVGGGKHLTEEYWERIMSSAFGFVEMYAHLMPLFVLSDTRLTKICAISTGYILEQVTQLSKTDGVEALDVATVPPQARGSSFNALDYTTLGIITRLSVKPVFLKTQKKLARTDIARILGLGVKGLVADPCVFSGEDEAYKEELGNLFSTRQEAPELQ